MPTLKNARHERFAQALAAGKTATDAYADAGYKPNDGNCVRLKGNERIARRVEEITAAAAKRVEIDKAWVLRKLVRNVKRAMQVTPVMEMVDGEWQRTGEFKYEGNVANNALKLIGLEFGMFVEKTKGDHNVKLTWADIVAGADKKDDDSTES